MENTVKDKDTNNEIDNAAQLNLPIFEKKDQILKLSEGNKVVVVAGETASGKSTQLPLFFLSDNLMQRGAIAVTQPRRIAAVSLANRVAEQTGTVLGSLVGYKIRFDQKLSDDTKVLYMTDGILLTEIQNDPLLEKYSIIVIDEAHERSLNIDFLLGYIRKILPRRPDLRVIISSATIDTQLFAKAFNAPIVEVSGRLYPVDVLYMPAGEEGFEIGSKTYVDAAIEAVEQIISLGDPGDILVFMPTERDILEMQDRLNGKKLRHTIIMPLFGRLSRSRQHRIFDPAPGGARKVVIATNIAETSITVPGIRFVVDTGLARISRYAPNLRTSRLPVEPVSRASADQRKGRCGRVSGGMCIRLYSEEDYLSREEFTVPEIKRSNLAGVILQMMSMRLGTIESFPFLEPPADRAVIDGFAHLAELGAIDENRRITPLGKKMARLPLDPHVSRMVLEARKRGALKEVMIIAAGLSVTDPRERPPDQQVQADAAHKVFLDEDSDFNTYLHLWHAYQEQWKQLNSQTRMRRFCKEHFLSFNRMREWHDVHEQVKKILYAMKGFTPNQAQAPYEAIHMSLLAGLLTNVAVRKEDKSGYRGVRGKEIQLFPGSVLFKKRPEWIMCHEIVETSRVFARTAASIQSHWLEELAPKLCRYRYEEPWFNEETGIVQAAESVLLFGLPIIRGRRVNYGSKKKKEASEIFIYEALVNQRLRTHHRFFHENKKLRDYLETAEAKLRTVGLIADENTIADFYKKRLGMNVTSVHELNRFVRKNKGDDILVMHESDLLSEAIPQEASEHPDHLTVAGKHLKLSYAFEPGRENDGITAHVPSAAVPYLNEETFGWLIKPLWPEKIHALLTQLPKEIRKRLMPLKERAGEIAQEMQFGPKSFSSSLASILRKKYGIVVDKNQFDESCLPPNLRMRIDIRDNKNRSIQVSRDAGVLSRVQRNPGAHSEKHWAYLFASHERKNIRSADIGEVPEQIEVGATDQGIPLFGYPALTPAKDCVSLMLYSSKEEASAVHIRGVRALMELLLREEIAWLEKDLNPSKKLQLCCVSFGGKDRIREILLDKLKGYILAIAVPVPRSTKQLAKRLEKAKEKSRGLAFNVLSLLEDIFDLHNECVSMLYKFRKKHPSGTYESISEMLEKELAEYMKNCFSSRLHYKMIVQYPRYLRAFRARLEKAFIEPGKYKEWSALLASYQTPANVLLNEKEMYPLDKQILIEEYAEMVEEFGISLFASQRVKTRYPISEKRLGKMMARIKEN